MKNLICSFLGGVAVTSAVGVFFVQRDLARSTGELNSHVLNLASQVKTTNGDLATRVANLEAQIAARK